MLSQRVNLLRKDRLYCQIWQAPNSPSSMLSTVEPSADPICRTGMVACTDAASLWLEMKYQILPVNRTASHSLGTHQARLAFQISLTITVGLEPSGMLDRDSPVQKQSETTVAEAGCRVARRSVWMHLRDH